MLIFAFKELTKRKHMRKNHLFTAALLAMALGTTQCTTAPEAADFKLKAVEHPISDASIEKIVNELYEKMSQEERIAQLHSMYVGDLFTDGKLDPEKCAKLIPNGVGHFSQYASQADMTPDETRDMVAQVQDWLMKNTPSGIPALFHEEVISGVNTLGATVYPQQIGLACSFNPELAELKTQQTAFDMRQIGGFLALSPMVDVCRNPYFNRLEESYGEDGYLSAAMGVGFVKGLQNGGLSQGIAACSKHFLGYGGGFESDDKEMKEEILFPHEAMIRIAGSKVVMTGYHAFHGTKAVANAELQQEILRDYLHFDGVMVSDYGSIDQIENLPTDLERAAASINAGNDVEFPRGLNYSQIQTLIDKGMITQERFEESVKRVLRLKARLGMLDKDAKLYATEHIEFDRPEERQTAYQLATQSVVLLQNQNNTLPLKDNKKIFLTGPNANSMWAMLGDYTYQGMAYFWQHREIDDQHPRIVNLRDGLENRKPEGFEISYTRGCDWTETTELIIEGGGDERAQQYAKWQYDRRIDGREEIDRAKAIQMAGESDVIIAAVGENTMLCGENRDRGSLRLPGSQEAFVEELIATGKPVVLVMFGGRSQVISKIADRCAAIIQAWYPGEEGGNALADIIYGKVSPSGKLSMSYPNVELNENICYNYATEQDSRIAWPFGFGLSYTTFEYANLKVDKEAATSDDAVRVSFDLTNSGDVAADEIVQLYLSPTSQRSQFIKPIRLQGFARVSLKPSETRHLEFLMSPQQFGYYANKQWNIDPGTYVLKVGASSTDIRLNAEVTLTGEKQEMPLRTVYFSELQK